MMKTEHFEMLEILSRSANICEKRKGINIPDQSLFARKITEPNISSETHLLLLVFKALNSGI